MSSTRERLERRADISEDSNRKITRSSHYAGMGHSVAVSSNVRSRLSRETPTKPARTQAQIDADGWYEMEMNWRQREKDEKLLQQHEQTARRKAKADGIDAEKRAKDEVAARKRHAGELELARIAREQEFEMYSLNNSQIREIMERLSPEDFRDIGATRVHAYCLQIQAERSQ